MKGLIAHIKNYISLDDKEALQLLTYFKLSSIVKKDLLLKEGDSCRHLHFVEKGCLRMYFVNDKGTEQITQFAIENWWMADYMSFERKTPSPFYIQAIENAEIISIDNLQQEELLKTIPKMERYFRMVLQRAYAAHQLRIKFLYDLSKEESYQHFISSFPGFAQRIPQYMLASYLGFTPEYLSEIRKKKS
ncbi:MAG TPA: Crp/Fnr family transcriptional regulator [Cyclobacteriaceae bacterium]